MTGSLSSIVHSEEELAGSYNWDYLLDWCPQYQNLAHVFKEISKLKDDDPSTANNAAQQAAAAAVSTLTAQAAQAQQLQPRQFPHFALKNPSIGKTYVFFLWDTAPLVYYLMLSKLCGHCTL